MDTATCNLFYKFFPTILGKIYCNSTYDNYLCWPPTLGGQTSVQPCPRVRFSDPKQFAFRTCGDNGQWLGRNINDTNINGWTNYTPCFPPLVQSLFFKVYDEGDAQDIFQIAQNTRLIEIIGFTTSFISLTISLIIMQKHKALHNLRTRIHKNLFLAMNAQVVLRLIVYIDQAVERSKEGTPAHTGFSTIENLPYICISVYVILEYFITVMYMWMLNEGNYLNSLVTSNVLRGKTSYKFFCIIGWIIPILITGVWAVIVAYDYADDTNLRCWYGYNFQSSYWLLQGPRLAVIVINVCFLLNIMRVLVMKLRQDKSSEVDKIRKAVKAAMVLLPLLGITDALNMFEGPVAGPVWLFALWSYSTHFLRSFQGSCLATCYCFLNEEVHTVMTKSTRNRIALLRYGYQRFARRLGQNTARSRFRDSSSGGTFRQSGGEGTGSFENLPDSLSQLKRNDTPLRNLQAWRKKTPKQTRLSQMETGRASRENVIAETKFGETTVTKHVHFIHINEPPRGQSNLGPRGEASTSRTLAVQTVPEDNASGQGQM